MQGPLPHTLGTSVSGFPLQRSWLCHQEWGQPYLKQPQWGCRVVVQRWSVRRVLPGAGGQEAEGQAAGGVVWQAGTVLS